MDAATLNDILETVITNGRWEDTTNIDELVVECQFEASERGIDWTQEDTGEVEASYGPYV